VQAASQEGRDKGEMEREQPAVACAMVIQLAGAVRVRGVGIGGGGHGVGVCCGDRYVRGMGLAVVVRDGKQARHASGGGELAVRLVITR